MNPSLPPSPGVERDPGSVHLFADASLKDGGLLVEQDSARARLDRREIMPPTMFGHPRCLRCDADLEYMPEGRLGCDAAAQEPVRVGLDLPSGWRVLDDTMRGTIILLSDSGLWTEIERDLWDRMRPTDPEAVAAASALVTAKIGGERGRVWVQITNGVAPDGSPSFRGGVRHVSAGGAMKIKIRLLVNGQWWWKLESETGAFIDAGMAADSVSAERAAEAAREAEMRRRSVASSDEDEANGW